MSGLAGFLILGANEGLETRRQGICVVSRGKPAELFDNALAHRYRMDEGTANRRVHKKDRASSCLSCMPCGYMSFGQTPYSKPVVARPFHN